MAATISKTSWLAILLTICTLAHATDFSQWHEVRGGAWAVDRSLWPSMQSQLLAAADKRRRSGRSLRPSAPSLASSEPVAVPSEVTLEVPQSRDVSAYVVQLQGQVVGGRRVVRLAGACQQFAEQFTDDLENIDTRFIEVFDGGDCFFDAVFDLKSKRLIRFSFHGLA